MKTDIEKTLLVAMDNDSISKKTESSRSFLDILSDNLSDVVIITDNQFTIESWNKAATSAFGLTETEAIGK